MTPADIDSKQFTTTRVREGYDATEVDDFLDRVIVAWREDRDSWTSAVNEISRLKRELTEAHRLLAAQGDRPTEVMPSAPESATRILEFAQKTADDVMESARQDAEDLLNRTRNEAELVKGEARSVAYQLGQEVKFLEARKAEVRDHLSDYLKSTLAELEGQ